MKKLITRFNAKAPEHPLLFAPGVAIRLNADGSLPEWIQAAPFGEHPTVDKSAVQIFDAAAAAQVIAWFNFFPRRIARLANINAIRVWIGHPDFAPDVWPERIDLGPVLELNADDKGLNARIGWVKNAIDHVAKHKFPSVAWDCEVNGDGTETPAMLWSIGMWHKPNIKTVAAVINACACESDDLPPGSTENQTETETTTMLKDIKEALIKHGLIKEEDSDDVALAAIGSAIQAAVWKREEEARRLAEVGEVRIALNAAADVEPEKLTGMLVERLNAATVDLASLNLKITEHEAWRTARINAVITTAMESGLITMADKDGVITELNADFDKGFAAIIGRRVQLNTQKIDIGAVKPAVMAAHERSTRLNAWVSEHMASKGVDYATAWESSKHDPQMKAIHEAMAAADTARASTGADA